MNISETHPDTSFRCAKGDILQPPRGISLPPARMPLFHRARLLKQWRYVAVWSAELLLSVCQIRVGPAYQEFWACWDGRTLHERTRLAHGPIDLRDLHVVIHDGDMSLELTLREIDSFQVLTFDKQSYTWTRKQLIQAIGSVRLGSVNYQIDAPGLVDDSAGYHPRHTRYKWSAGAGKDLQGRSVAWNLVVGINDLATNSERTVWVDGMPKEIGPVRIDDGLSSVIFTEGTRLDFQPKAVRETHDNLIVIRSHYRHPFGTYSGTLPGNIELRDAYGVMEDHDVYW